MKRLFLLLSIIYSAVTFAADIIVIGQVFDEIDISPISQANIFVKGTKIGATSSKEGYFIIYLPQETNELTVSVLGYKTQKVKLKKGIDQKVDVFMKPQVMHLDEVVILPNTSRLNEILKLVKKNRVLNDPSVAVGYSVDVKDESKLFINRANERLFKEKIFKNLAGGLLTTSDSTLILPLYNKNVEYRSIVAVDSVETQGLNVKRDVVDLLPEEEIDALVTSFYSKVNIYNNKITVFQTNYISPISYNSDLYYNYFLEDSAVVNNIPCYHIRFKPKVLRSELFRGEMWVAKSNYAIVKHKLLLRPAKKINAISNMYSEQEFDILETGGVINTKDRTIVEFDFKLPGKNNLISAIIEKHYTAHSVNNVAYERGFAVDTIGIQVGRKEFVSAIDSLNKSKLINAASILATAIIHGHIPASYVDFGPILNVLRFNSYEGTAVQLPIRTSEKLMKNISVGGFFGYGFRNKEWNYGAEIQARFGENYKHQFSFGYEDEVYRYGYRNNGFTLENWSHNISNNIYTIPINPLDDAYKLRHFTLQYKYEDKGLKVNTTLQSERFLANQAIKFQQEGVFLDYITNHSLNVTLRLSFDEKVLAGYFHNFYLRSQYPVLEFISELGYYRAGVVSNPYVDLQVSVKQKVAIPFAGTLRYYVNGGMVLGDVPFPLLHVVKGSNGIVYSYNNFSLQNRLDLVYDRYVSMHFHYTTPGWLFNSIPWIKLANFKEDFIFKMSYGTVRDSHNDIVNFQSRLYPLFQYVPYIEAGVGVSNIFKVFSIQSLWRLTQRDLPNATLWAINFGVTF